MIKHKEPVQAKDPVPAKTQPVKSFLNEELFSQLTFDEKMKALKNLEESIKKDKSKEQKRVIAEFIAKIKLLGMTIEQAVSMITAAPTKKSISGGKKSSSPSGLQPKWGMTYRNPANGEVWTKSPSGKGGVKKWLLDAVKSGKTYEEFEVK